MSKEDLLTRLFYVDAFTSSEDATLQGNPAGVLITSRPLQDKEAESIARKLAFPALAILPDPNLYSSGIFDETADVPVSFLAPSAKWIPLCGHATLSASLVLFQLFPDLQNINYMAKHGSRVAASRSSLGAEIQFPAFVAPTELTIATREEILNMLNKASQGGIKEDDVVHLAEAGEPGAKPNVLVELKSSLDLASLKITPDEFLAIPYHGIWMFSPTPTSSPEDIRVRVFFPDVGIPEDQVCGRAHTLIVPYFAHKNDLVKKGEATVLSKQVSGRGGKLRVRWDGKFAEEDGRVWLAGEGKIIDRGPLDTSVLDAL